MSTIAIFFIAYAIWIPSFPVTAQDSENALGFDTKNPIIYRLRKGNDRSHFGWSVTLLHKKSGAHGKAYWLFVGDPLGNSTDESYSEVKEPGVVWRCSIVINSTESTPDCRIMNIDPIDGICSTGNYNKKLCEGIKPVYEYHDGNWVGGTLLSNNNRFVTCAHRWYRGKVPVGEPPARKYPLMNGLCYWFNKDTMYSNWSEPTSFLNIGKPNYGETHRLIPYFGNDPLEGQYSSNSITPGDDDPELAFAEGGFSVHLTELTNGQQELLIGAPGGRLFSGVVTRYRDDGSTRMERPRFSTVRLATRYNSYFGYAVTSGQYYNKGEVWYAGGSPRANMLEGRVDLFQFPDKRDGFGWESRAERLVIEIKHPVRQLGSYFGSVLVSANVNNDSLGLDELFVGAPFQNTYPSIQSAGDHGAVFVFYKPYSSSIDLVHCILTGSSSPGSRFGSSIASIGDINEDEFNDIAIGAPYEGPDSEGAVYIFYGKEDIGNDWKYGLRISGADYVLPFGLRGFGCSFSNAIDIDGNGTPDLAIGSYLSKSILILRTRPRLHIKPSLNFYLNSSSGKQIFSVESNVSTFSVEFCVGLYRKYLPAHLGKTTKYSCSEIEITLKIDERHNRFIFRNESKTNTSTIAVPKVISTGMTSCSKVDVALISKDGDIGDSADIPPITFQLSAEYKDATVKKSRVTMIYEINGNGPVKSPTDPDHFCSSCPFSVGESISQLLPIASDCKDINHCRPDIVITAWFKRIGDSTNVTKVVLKWDQKFKLCVSLFNRGEPAFMPEVSVNFNSQSNRVPVLESSICKSQVGRKQEFICSLEKHIKRNEDRLLEIPFSLKGIYMNQESELYEVHLTAGGKMDDITNRSTFNITLEVVTDSWAQLIGSVTSPSYIVPAGNLFHQDYTGKLECETGLFSEFSKLDAEIELNEKKPTLNDSDEIRVSQNRRRREMVIEDTELRQSERITPNEKSTFTWTCTALGIQCLEVNCLLHHVQPGKESIQFQMKLDVNITYEQIKMKNLLLLESSGDVKLFVGNIWSNNDSVTAKGFSQTMLKLDTILISPGTSLMVYIGSGIGGTILLILITVFLYRAGFFKRSMKQQLEELKAQTEIQRSQSAAPVASRRNSLIENIELDVCT